MTATTASSDADGTLQQATRIVDLAQHACEAYDRADLAGRLAGVRATLADPVVHIVVVGEFKQGKSSLVNGLVGHDICPVDDDVATALPTYIRFGKEPSAQLLLDEVPPRREPVPIDRVREFVLEKETEGAVAGVTGVEVRLPRRLLSSGLVIVDTPGVGGLGSVHAAASLTAASMADALLFVTDAAQELTRSELQFLRQAREVCSTAVCVLTKTDFYPHWRKIRDLDAGHLHGEADMPIIAVSSDLRRRAVAGGDKELNAESGFPDLVKFVAQRVSGGAATRAAAQAGASVVGVCEQIESQFEAERAALADPAAAAKVMDDLNEVRQRVEALKTAAAKWQQTLSDGIADLSSDIDHDLRGRFRRLVEEADAQIEEGDPADVWEETERWLLARVSDELLANYMMLRDRSIALSDDVAGHFQEAAGQALRQVAVTDPVSLAGAAQVDHKIELAKMKVGKQAMVALKSAYGGALMFTMLGTLAGVALGPIGVGIGLVMGRKGLREEKKRQRTSRQSQARNAIRRYCDEVSFVMTKDSRDTLRRIQRQLRDHYSGLADELSRSNTRALSAAAEAAQRTKAEREARLRDLTAEIDRLRQLREHASAIVS
ncbi:dynamin family protein [Micromonospora sp. Llam7]|uniref:dynamin family protein n=1 Tax=Micromonospora tarapacensis TaxID=2835305 RepID=UPI001C835DC4|nr:dynamin family protein [Micromonospora tarapacensis]MBX7267428.1 dynamin family protein [Micromonospora tarapacensis]